MFLRILTAALFLFAPLAAQAVVINEIAWMGTLASANDEWLELYNPDAAAVDLTGWQIIADDGSPAINLSGSIPASGYFLLERTSDSTVASAAAQQIYTGALSNSGEALSLKDAGGTTIDRVTQWFGGTNEPKATMVRLNAALAGADPAAWGTSSQNAGAIDAGGNAIVGTPGAVNEAVNPNPPPDESTPPPPGGSSPTPKLESVELQVRVNTADPYKSIDQLSAPLGQPLYLAAKVSGVFTKINWLLGNGASRADVRQLEYAYEFPGVYFITLEVINGAEKLTDQLEAFIYAKGIFLSEFMPNSEGADTDQEWLEVANTGGYLADIGNFIIEAGAASVKRFVVPPRTYIAPQSYLVIPLKETPLTLGNSQGQLNFLYPNEVSIDAITYEDAPEGQSAIRQGADFVWSTKPTPGFGNILNPTEPRSTAAALIKNVAPHQTAALSPVTGQSAAVKAADLKGLALTPPENFLMPVNIAETTGDPANLNSPASALASAASAGKTGAAEPLSQIIIGQNKAGAVSRLPVLIAAVIAAAALFGYAFLNQRFK